MIRRGTVIRRAAMNLKQVWASVTLGPCVSSHELRSRWEPMYPRVVCQHVIGERVKSIWRAANIVCVSFSMNVDDQIATQPYPYTPLLAISANLSITAITLRQMCKWTACKYTCGHEGPDAVRSEHLCDDFLVRMDAHKANPHTNAIPTRCPITRSGAWRNFEPIPMKMPCPACWSSSFWQDKSTDAKSLSRGHHVG